MPHPPFIQAFADERTLFALRAESPRVLLLGGYLGYPNFGDILQLKGAIAWHRARNANPPPGRSPAHTAAEVSNRLEPVIVCDTGAITDAGFVGRVRNAFDVEHIVFLSTSGTRDAHSLSRRAPDLHRLEHSARITHLHLYGGGYLNSRWGEHILSSAEFLHRSFGVGHYVISGVQAERDFSDRISTHVERCSPLLIGGRDDESVGILAEIDPSAAYSFDDAAEAMTALADRLRSDPSSWFNTRRSASTRAPRALVHLNVSPYAADSANALQTLSERLDSIIQQTANPDTANGEAQKPDAVLLHAYNDPRIDQVADTLGVVLRLGDRFPLVSHHVAHLGVEALQIRIPLTPSTDPNRPSLGANASTSDIAFVCSYHAAMLAQMLGVPTWLEVRNAYYRQKAAGLGLLRTTTDSPIDTTAAFRTFLHERPFVSLDQPLARRTEWLKRLAAAYEEPARPNSPGDAVATPQIATSTAVQVAAAPSTTKPISEDTSSSTDSHIATLEAWVRELETARDWLQAQLRNYQQLAVERESANADAHRRLESVARESQEHKTLADRAQADLQAALDRIAQLQGGVDWLEPQYHAWKARAAELHQYLEEITPSLRHAHERIESLESQRSDLQTALTRIEREKAELLAELDRARAAHAS